MADDRRLCLRALGVSWGTGSGESGGLAKPLRASRRARKSGVGGDGAASGMPEGIRAACSRDSSGVGARGLGRGAAGGGVKWKGPKSSFGCWHGLIRGTKLLH